MKTLNFIISIVLLSSLISYANKEKILKSKLKNVTVFLSSAQVHRTANFTIDKGITELIFEDVSPYINTEGLQAKGNGNYIILDVRYRIKQPEPELPSNTPLPPKIMQDIRITKDSLSYLRFDIDNFNNKKEVLELEKRVLLQNRYMQGNVDTIPELKEAMAYLRKQLNDINKELNIIKREKFKLDKEKFRLEEKLDKLQKYNQHKNLQKPKKTKHQIVVTVSCDAATSGDLTISYLVNNAGWTPEYDLRVKSTNQPVFLVLKANVYQNSGEDWNDVKLKLSTITPNVNNHKPNLGILYLNYYTAYNYQSPKGKRSPVASYSGVTEDLPTAMTSADFTQMQQTMTNVEYDINLPYTIKSDGKSHKVAIKNHKLKAEYYHYIVPKLDKNAYLVAKVTDYSALDLLPGQAVIYFEGTYVGKTSISPNMMTDTMELALGTDRGLVVERTKTKDKEEMKYELIGNNVVKKISYTIKVRNNKPIASHIIIEDQLPVSKNEDIRIKALKISNADYDEETGMLKWKFSLSPNSTKDIEFSYSVEYNKNKQLANVF